MTAKPKVPWEIRLGTIGESAIKTRLAYFSIPTKYETDVGIDFYCELLENDSPSTPFYVQAKGSEHFDAKWGRSLPASTIRYWLGMEFPVFLVVYDERTRICYWMSIEEHRYSLVQKIVKARGSSVYISLDRSNVLEEGKGKNLAFVARVRDDVTSVRLFQGYPMFVGDEYVKKIPPPPRSDVELERIRENVRADLYSLIQHYWRRKGDLVTAWHYCAFLAEFDKHHYNHFVWFGILSKELGKFDLARASLEEAKKICEADKEWPTDSMSKVLRAIDESMSVLPATGREKPAE